MINRTNDQALFEDTVCEPTLKAHISQSWKSRWQSDAVLGIYFEDPEDPVVASIIDLLNRRGAPFGFMVTALPPEVS